MKVSKIALIGMAALALASCSGRGSSSRSSARRANGAAIDIVKEDGVEYASFDAMKDAFDPDFSYKYVDEEEDEDRTQSQGKKSAKKEKSEVKEKDEVLVEINRELDLLYGKVVLKEAPKKDGYYLIDYDYDKNESFEFETYVYKKIK